MGVCERERGLLLEFFVDATLDSVCLQPQVHIAITSMVDVILVSQMR